MFQEFPKIARLNREVIVTEKIDGTNAQIYVVDTNESPPEAEIMGNRLAFVEHEGRLYDIFAGSRNRFLRLGDDNFGFAKWVYENAQELVKLGPGRHFGEWWGHGIQRGYGLPKGEKRFSLFNVSRRSDNAIRPACCHVVPVIRQGVGMDFQVHWATIDLRQAGSYAAPGFMKPEGVVAFHTHSNSLFKVTLENDELPKSRAAA